MSFELPAGTIIDGRYEILSSLGQGGLGTVYKAKLQEIDRIVAIKFLHVAELQDDESKERFRREGLALSALRHDNIPQLYHFGIWEETTPYLVMEYLSGATLRNRLSFTSPLPWTEALQIAGQICLAMEHAHSHGIIHRDIKPENIMLDNQSQAKVCDFGLARLTENQLSQSTETLTKTGLLIGSANYMSPEQCSGNKADARSDIYSLGCMLYEMLTGEVPFQADSPMGVIHKQIHETIPLVSSKRSDYPHTIDTVLLRALSKHPDKRYQSMSEFGSDLDAILLGKEPHATRSHYRPTIPGGQNRNRGNNNPGIVGSGTDRIPQSQKQSGLKYSFCNNRRILHKASCSIRKLSI